MANDPTMQKRRMMGSRTARGTPQDLLTALDRGQPNGSISRLARMKTMKTRVDVPAASREQRRAGIEVLHESTPITIAVIVSPGMPKTSAGI